MVGDTVASEDQKEVIVGVGKVNNRACVCNITLKQFECLRAQSWWIIYVVTGSSLSWKGAVSSLALHCDESTGSLGWS